MSSPMSLPPFEFWFPFPMLKRELATPPACLPPPENPLKELNYYPMSKNLRSVALKPFMLVSIVVKSAQVLGNSLGENVHNI